MMKNKVSVIILSIAVGASLLLAGCDSRKTEEVSSGTQSDSASVGSAQIETTQEPEQTPEQAKESQESASNTESETSLPDDLPMKFSFLSGAGAWSTSLILDRDGSFHGIYKDADMYEISICIFSGQFNQIEKVNEYTYSMKLADLKYKYKVGKKWKKNSGEIYTATDAYGLEKGKTFYLYTPQAPRKKLSKEFLSWDTGKYIFKKEPKKLKYYGLYNKKMGYGFFNSPNM